MDRPPVFYISSESDDEPIIINDTWLNDGNVVLPQLSEIKCDQSEASTDSESKPLPNEDELGVQNLLSYEQEVALKQLEDLGNEVDLLCAETLADFNPNFLDNIDLSFLDQEQMFDPTAEEALYKLLTTNQIDMESGYIDEAELKQICSDMKEMDSDENNSCEKISSHIELQNVKLEELKDCSKLPTAEYKTDDSEKISHIELQNVKLEELKDYSNLIDAQTTEHKSEETEALECTSDDSEAIGYMTGDSEALECKNHDSEASNHKSRDYEATEDRESEASEAKNEYSKASIEKIHKPTNCIFKNSECFICSTIKGDINGDKTKVRSDELYYDWFVRDVTKDRNSQKKRKLDDTDEGHEIVVKHFKPTDSFDLFRTVTGSEFSVGSSSDTTNDDEQLTEQEKAIYREKEKDMARSLLHILTAPYFELKYPEEKRAMFIMSRASENLLSLTRELFTMYRHVIRRRGRIYMQTIDQKQCMI